MQEEIQIKSWTEEKLKDFPHLFLVDLHVQNLAKVTILIDGDKGVNVAECAELSRFVGQNIEEKELIKGAYVLDVCSPGVDFPIKFLRQLPKHIGRRLNILMNDGADFEAELKGIEGEELIVIRSIKDKGKKAIESELRIDFNQTKKIKVLVSFK